MNLKDKGKTRLVDLSVNEISFVDDGANNKRYFLMKRNNNSEQKGGENVEQKPGEILADDIAKALSEEEMSSMKDAMTMLSAATSKLAEMCGYPYPYPANKGADGKVCNAGEEAKPDDVKKSLSDILETIKKLSEMNEKLIRSKTPMIEKVKEVVTKLPEEQRKAFDSLLKEIGESAEPKNTDGPVSMISKEMFANVCSLAQHLSESKDTEIQKSAQQLKEYVEKSTSYVAVPVIKVEKIKEETLDSSKLIEAVDKFIGSEDIPKMKENFTELKKVRAELKEPVKKQDDKSEDKKIEKSKDEQSIEAITKLTGTIETLTKKVTELEKASAQADGQESDKTKPKTTEWGGLFR